MLLCVHASFLSRAFASPLPRSRKKPRTSELLAPLTREVNAPKTHAATSQGQGACCTSPDPLGFHEASTMWGSVLALRWSVGLHTGTVPLHCRDHLPPAPHALPTARRTEPTCAAPLEQSSPAHITKRDPPKDTVRTASHQKQELTGAVNSIANVKLTCEVTNSRRDTITPKLASLSCQWPSKTLQSTTTPRCEAESSLIPLDANSQHALLERLVQHVKPGENGNLATNMKRTMAKVAQSLEC